MVDEIDGGVIGMDADDMLVNSDIEDYPKN